MTNGGYSQFGEDLEIAKLFPASFVGRYIDIGAGHPIIDNNTFLFYQRGWRGLLIDPVPKHAQLLQSERPEDITLQVAIAAWNGMATFYEDVEAPTVSTLIEEEVQTHRRIDSYKVRVTSVSDLVREMDLNPPPELMSIDVEGAERQVLEGIPFEQGWRPKVVVIESCKPRTFTPCFDEWEHILNHAGYVLHRQVQVNRIYIQP